MICPQCIADEHSDCEDTLHPDQDYRGCACQHAQRAPAKGDDVDAATHAS